MFMSKMRIIFVDRIGKNSSKILKKIFGVSNKSF